MRKKYGFITIVVCLSVMALWGIFVFIVSGYYIHKINIRFSDEKIFGYNERLEYFYDTETPLSISNAILRYYDDIMCNYCNDYEYISCFGEMLFSDGEKKGSLELTDYAVINKSIEHIFYTNNARIIRFGNDDTDVFKEIERYYYNYPSITGKGDEVFLRSGIIDPGIDAYEPFSIPFFTENMDMTPFLGEISDINMKSDEETGGDRTQIYFYDLPIREQAIRIHKKVASKLKPESNKSIISKKGFFTSYLIFINRPMDYLDFEMRTTFIINPFMIVLETHLSFYIISLIILLLVECVSVIYIRKFYLKKRTEKYYASVLTEAFSKELESPIANLKQSIDEWGKNDEKVRANYSEQIVAGVDQMDSMIKTQLLLSNISSGKTKLQYEDINLYELTNVVLKQLKSIANQKQRKISVRADHPEECMVVADLEILKLIVGNLIVHGILTSERDILIDISSGREIKFKITMDGLRFEREVIEKMWTKQYGRNYNGAKQFGRYGLGLEITKEMLCAHKASYGSIANLNGISIWFKMNRAK